MVFATAFSDLRDNASLNNVESNLNRLGEHKYLQNCSQRNIPLKEQISAPVEITKNMNTYSTARCSLPRSLLLWLIHHRR